jgi:hypothetical protein
MKKSALYALPVLVCLLTVLWFRRSTPSAEEAAPARPSDEPVTASPSRAAGRSALRSGRQVPFGIEREQAAVQTTMLPPEAPAQVSPRDLLRAPVVDAIRADLKGEDKRKAMLEAIRSSGESDEEWTAEAADAFETWSDAMPKEVRSGISVAEPRCYNAGCVADLTFSDEPSYRAAAKAFRAISETRSGHGGRVQTPSQPQGKRVVASWIMLRPQDI